MKFYNNLFLLLLWIIKIRLATTLASAVLCSRIPGLSPIQRQMCTESPDAIIALGAGHMMGAKECQHQFKGHRWNCTQVWHKNVFGHVMFVGSREAAFTYAIASAGAVHEMTMACAKGNISQCGCDLKQHHHNKHTQDAGGYPAARHRYNSILNQSNDNFSSSSNVNSFNSHTPEPWKWGGCSADITFGMKFAKKFLDVKEIENDARSLMNLHNNRVGRKIVKSLMKTECKCHGVSGSCAMKTCWWKLPSFRTVGEALMKRYNKAKMVRAVKDKQGLNLVLSRRRDRNSKKHVYPKRMELVYLEQSPNYCERNLHLGSLGTQGRKCNRTAVEIEGCDLLCCGRGYNTHQINRTWQCRCKFQWCCQVQCEVCEEHHEEYTCK
ncbi:WNT7A family protein [Megaselia abdita]